MSCRQIHVLIGLLLAFGVVEAAPVPRGLSDAHYSVSAESREQKPRTEPAVHEYPRTVKRYSPVQASQAYAAPLSYVLHRRPPPSIYRGL